MKVRYALMSLLLAGADAVNAQGIVTLTDDDGAVVNGTVVYKPLTPGYSTDTVKIHTMVVGDVPREVNVRRYELWPVAGSYNFFCWGVCYLEQPSGALPTWTSQHPITMSPGSSYSNFGAYYMPEGNTGATRFRYVWYATDDPQGADSSWVDIDFGGTVGFREQEATDVSLDVWPNPALGVDVQVRFDLAQRNPGAELVMYDLLGARVRRIPLVTGAGRRTLATGDLAAGVYFVSLEHQGRALQTRRVVITR